MKLTLLDIVQRLLLKADSDNVNSITDTIEAEQAAAVVRDVYEANVATRKYKELEGIWQLESLADSEYPNYLKVPDSIYNIKWIHYNKSTNNKQEYRPVYWCEPHDFLRKIEALNEDNTNIRIVYERGSGTPLLIRKDAMPQYYTSFEEDYLVFDSYDSDVETTLQGNKSRAFGKKLRTFTISDDFVPELNDWEFPGLLAEATSVFMSIYKGTVDPKIDQMARRQRSFRQNESILDNGNSLPDYGR